MLSYLPKVSYSGTQIRLQPLQACKSLLRINILFGKEEIGGTNIHISD
jgi:hypothetical protein